MADNITGVLLRAEKGLYFISDKDLEKFKVPQDQEKPALQVLDRAGILKGPTDKAEIHTLEALHGPLGSRGDKLDWNRAAINPTIPDKILLEKISRRAG